MPFRLTQNCFLTSDTAERNDVMLYILCIYCSFKRQTSISTQPLSADALPGWKLAVEAVAVGKVIAAFVVEYMIL